MNSNPSPSNCISRRSLFALGGVAATGVVAAPFLGETLRSRYAVFLAKNQRYDGELARTIRDGLLATGTNPEQFRDKRVLLKPNLVEPSRHIPHMTTHPAVVIAAAEVFRNWGATVRVGEAPGHVRDTEIALEESGVREALDDERLEFADLNYEEIGWRRNRGKKSNLAGLFFPRSVLEADYVVSMPKLKTHHWIGMTCSMKNLYGVLPGIKYGWPKNVLHYNGIPETVVDINASLPTRLAIVDAIDCMEGDGPILGTCKPMGLILVGNCLTAVDATAARIIGLEPERIKYLAMGSPALGPIDEARIEQRGESWQSVASPFQILDEPHLQKLRVMQDGPLVS